MKNWKQRRGRKGQAIVEYIIIIAIVAVASLAVIGIFGDRIRSLFQGTTEALGGEQKDDTGSSRDTLKNIDDVEF